MNFYSNKNDAFITVFLVNTFGFLPITWLLALIIYNMVTLVVALFFYENKGIVFFRKKEHFKQKNTTTYSFSIHGG
jgi:hypothetical protein